MEETPKSLSFFLRMNPTDLDNMDASELDQLLQEYAADMSSRPITECVTPEPDEFFDALSTAETSAQTIEEMIERGANPNATRVAGYETDQHALAVAVKAGNPDIVEVLLRHGADATFTNSQSYSIIVHACYADKVRTSAGLLSILRQLIEHGADINSQTSYSETPVRVLSRFCRYDGIALLLEYGASTDSIQWTDLHKAVALGTIEVIEDLVRKGADINALDWQDRTPVMIALQIGDLAKVKCLVGFGAQFDTTPESKSSPLECAAQSLNPEVLQFYLGLGMEYVPHHMADQGPINIAIEYGNEEMGRITYEAFKNSPHIQTYLNQVLDDDEDGQYARWLLELGANSIKLEPSARRVLLGHDKIQGDPLESITEVEYKQDRSPRFGHVNPEEITSPFWLAMIQCRSSAYRPRMKFNDEPVFACGPEKDPVWCACRFGQTFTYLPDGRVVEIAGEHEDGYDPDFCIYNDVFVHHPDGKTQIFIYPKDVFPPTDFHSATLVGDWIYIVGSLGYPIDRFGDAISVFRLSMEDFHIEKMHTQNPVGFQLYGHDTKLRGHQLLLNNGNRIYGAGESQRFEPNTQTIILDLDTLSWTIES